MLKMSSQIETIVNAYKTLSKIPTIAGGRLNNAGNKITSVQSVRNIDKGKNSKYLYNYVLDDNLNVLSRTDYGVDVSNELLSAVSPKETFKAVIREEKDNKDTKKQYLEIWRLNAGLTNCIDLTALDIHGDVYADSEFGSLDWSQDETAVVYVAERKLKKSEPYIKRSKAEDASKSGGGDPAPKKGEEYVYRQDWGEQLVGKHLSVVVVCKIETEAFTVLEGLPESCCPGQVRFAPDGKSVVGVAWETEPRRLGLIFCTNRPSFIFDLTLDGKLTKLSAEGKAVRSPRFRPNGDLIWLQRAADGPHHACHALVINKKGQSEVSPIIDIVQTEIATSQNKPFYGLYNQSLPKNCFTKDGASIVFSTPSVCDVKTYTVDIESGKIAEIASPNSRSGSLAVLDVKNDVILAYFSDMQTPAQLYVSKLPSAGKEGEIKWNAVSEAVKVPESLANSTIHYLTHKHENTDDAVKTFSSLYLAPKSSDKLPLIVWPHGGPHSGFVNAYSLEAALFNMLGFASLRINYRGSTGHGDASVRCLLSNAGRIDVDDCYLALSDVLERNIDSVSLLGGSYGGFLVAHLAGKWPERFRSVVMRNPLIDMATKGHYADNSDGCAVEAGFPFTEKGQPSEEELITMRRCSPLVHVHKVKAPTAFMLGKGDKRVPHYQGLDMARRLKANGVETRVYMYDDNHSLSSLPHEMDQLINSASWLLEHLP
ncbi:acylamino-acid-releasing enzyme-like isoform X2 [Leguminivora glycinivorella]|uniref:acylamino-acid-releasing enzyme-like isoform X2 n=1 Tax=Leguminivora glycinivorella TaxID=1035111 RepID=UPI00200C786B|nr:acylamino-acid-releasing enzyme-like isoform X2 [Leguminivora glycinivorella]